MMSERRTFGERLKRQRERCGISLESISQATKVPVGLYAGLERGDCSRWPGGLYGRAYIRAYAEAIRLNAAETAETVEEFSAMFGEAPTSQPGGTGVQKPAGRGNLRLVMAEDPAIRPEYLARRAALAAAELVVGFLIASVAYVGFGASAWITVISVLAYFVAGRLVSDEPLLYWIFQRTRSAGTRTSPEPPSETVPVGDAASTAA